LKSLQELIKGAFTTGQCDWVKWFLEDYETNRKKRIKG
jgi:hypothetical protein